MRKRRKWLGVPLEKKWQRRIFVCALYGLLFSLIPLRFAVGPVTVHPITFDNPWPMAVLLNLLSLFLWKLYRDKPVQTASFLTSLHLGSSRKRPMPLPTGTLDEREQAMRNSAHVWAYNVLFIVYMFGLAAYFATGGNVSPAIARIFFDSMVFVGPLLILTLPDAVQFWMEPDWVVESAPTIAKSLRTDH